MDNIDKPLQGKVTGVIIPPPEIRAVVDKTAQYVAKAGKSFEQRILDSKEGKTAKFNFMKADDPYHAYYELKIREAEEAIAAGKDPSTVAKPAPKPDQPQPTAAKTTAPSQPKSISATTAKAQPVNPIAKYAKDKPDRSPYNLEFIINHPTDVSALDIDIIKLTAQYTAVNGRDFLASLAQREQRNPQFDFLKPTHMLFSYFTSLVDSYAKIVHPNYDLLQLIQSRCHNDKVYEYSIHRWSWTKAEEERKKREEYQENEEKLAFQTIDWTEFTVVEVINFPEDELFEIPGLSNLGINNNNTTTPSNTNTQPPPPAPPVKVPIFPVPPLAASKTQSTAMVVDDNDDEEIKVVSNYQPRIGGQTTSSAPLMMIDPVSGRAIPVEQLEEHMRIQLLDPKWKEQQNRFIEKQKETGYAEGSSIADNLKLFARKRGDIFGQGTSTTGDDSAAAIAEVEALERRKAEAAGKVQWDGFISSMQTTQQLKSQYDSMNPVPPPPPMTSMSSIGPMFTTPAVNAMIPPPPPAAAPSYFPPPPLTAAVAPPPPPPVSFPFPAPGMAMPGYAPTPPIGIPPMPPMPVIPGIINNNNNANPDESKAKKPRIDASSLIPAEEFAAIYSGPCNIDISLPNDSSNAQHNLNGQTVTLHVTVLTTVKELKEMLSNNHLNQMGTGKIQLKHNVHGFLKDANSLASLNLGNGTSLEMSVKSRGGKR